MTTNTSLKRFRRRGRTLGLGFGLGLALLANLGDRAFSASAANSGIDPLQVLDVAVKNNILFLVSNSGSMAGTVQQSGDIVGGDDPASRFYQVKRAVREVVQANAGTADFGLATFQPDFQEHQIDGTQSLMYVTQDPTGNNYRNNFNQTGGSSLGINFKASQSFTTNGPYTITNTTWTPTANSLLVAMVLNTAGTPVNPNATSPAVPVAGHGVTYTLVSTSPANVAIAGAHSMSIWVALAGPTPTNAGLTARWGSNRGAGAIMEYEITGADVSSIANAIVQKPVTSGTSGTAATTLAAASNSANAVMYFVMHAARQVTDFAPGWTEPSAPAQTGDISYSSGSNDVGVESQFNLTFATSASATWATTDKAWAGIALEIKTAPAPTLVDSCATPGACTATESRVIFDLLRSNDAGTTSAYPVGCTNQASNQVNPGPGATVNTPITHTLDTHCRYYIKSKVRLGGRRYKVNRGAAAASAITTSANITCPPPPPGLLGDDVLATADGSKSRACFQLEDVTPAATDAITTYWLTGTKFDYVNVTPNAGSTDRCDQSGINVDVSDCAVDNSATIRANLRMELQYDLDGMPTDVPALTLLDARKPQSSLSPAFQNVGIRLGSGTPIKKALDFALDYFKTTVLPAGGTLKRPVAAQGKQKQFVILIVDGDESCSATLAELKTAAYALWGNALPALPALTPAQAAAGITQAQLDIANRIELLVVSYAGGTQATVDEIAEAGSGKNSTTGVCDAGAPCRTSPIVNNRTELVTALNNALSLSGATGEFSDQQSVTETVFEFAGVATSPKDPLDPEDRYAVSVPILMQSTFELPSFKGHLNAFRRDENGTPANLADDITVQEWDAGQKLRDRLVNATNGLGAAPGTACTASGAGCRTFAELYGDVTDPLIVAGTTAKIKRRIFTTTQNGVLASTTYTPANILANAAALAGSGTGSELKRVSLWPPLPTGTADNTFVAPADTSGATVADVRGILDTAMGFDAFTTVADVQGAVPGACQGTVPGNIHAKCTSATAGVPLARAKREAREIVLAYIAGAQVQSSNGIPVRATSTELLYVVRPWIMVESTLAAPGVVTPPLLAGPQTAPGAVGVAEYRLYRDGPKQSSGAPVAGQVLLGLGLRNPDRIGPAPAPSPAPSPSPTPSPTPTPSAAIIAAAAADPNLKPVMSVVYHATNQGLHAFRAGPCPVAASGSGLFGTALNCENTLDGLPRETGGEELWSFVPFDQLGKLPALVKPQGRGNKQYLLASPVRFSDVFVPGGATIPGGAVPSSVSGVWRTMLFFGRGQGGKYYTALDITAPGPFTQLSVSTQAPIVVWSRGNPDTTNGLAVGTANNTSTALDSARYLKMGETWSVPSVAFVTAANYTTARTGSNGTNFVLFTGSGYSDTAGEGKTFFTLDALTGDIVRSFDIADGNPPVQTPVLSNFLVASPVYIAEDAAGNSPSGFRFLGNPIAVKAKTVYFGDLHSRIWRYDVNAPGTAPVAFFTADTAAVGNQPFATAVSVLQNRPDATVPGDILIYAEAGYDRRVAENPAKPFKVFAWKDTNGVRTDVFEKDFQANYRGTVQPSAAFGGATIPPAPVVFFAGIKFNAGCVSTFDSVLIALRGITSTPGTAQAAFDLRATGDDSFIELIGKKVNAIRVSGEGNLVIDQGLNAQNVPPPPGMPVASEVISGSSNAVSTGLTPGTQPYKHLVATTIPYRIGSSVCRTEY